MEVRDYLSIRRAYNIVRQTFEAEQRLTFSELAILCRLHETKVPLRTSDIADYQASLRPTMTHRTKHLEHLGYIERVRGGDDHRNVVCVLTDEGDAIIDELCEKIRIELVRQRSSSRMTRDRICRTVDVMGAVNYTASDLLMLYLSIQDNGSATISKIVEDTGFLQPTVSMSASALARDGLALRERVGGTTNAPHVVLTDKGIELGNEYSARVSSISVPRNRRSK